MAMTLSQRLKRLLREIGTGCCSCKRIFQGGCPALCHPFCPWTLVTSYCCIVLGLVPKKIKIFMFLECFLIVSYKTRAVMAQTHGPPRSVKISPHHIRKYRTDGRCPWQAGSKCQANFRLVGTVPHPGWQDRPMGTMEEGFMKYNVLYL